MSATSSLELLKAHAVTRAAGFWHRLSSVADCSRARVATDSSLLYARTTNLKSGTTVRTTPYSMFVPTTIASVIGGITKATSEKVTQAVHATRGQILMDGDGFATHDSVNAAAAQPERVPVLLGEYQETVPHCRARCGFLRYRCRPVAADLTVEANAEKWIRPAPRLSATPPTRRFFPRYLTITAEGTTDFYRWHVTYTQEQLQRLVTDRLKMDFGDIVDLIRWAWAQRAHLPIELSARCVRSR